MCPLKSNSEGTLLRKREGKMWGDKKDPPWGGRKGLQAEEPQGNSWEGCVLVILLRSGDALETAELREGDAQGGPGALRLQLHHQVSTVPQR